ncbi:phenylalanine--tRNA ligase subunit beta [Halolamina sp. R1-12]|uniref:Phenylalanine--tRNA ligase beta subunit n=1 Tax=Halolamina pelagica TaxID=699431 RepID=A0A1I5SP79_9EURY|nr:MULTISPECIES: phenylalanine--tRNA ligase subunit beta [Halolamina]NHX36960.1 phenylalanine--tRNA ligase subunit beta [Halolamina sp. R1-12]SFP72451.1 phenylalanyl-tRNA synthetase beta subunit [Halolamina pelagica]
MPVVDIDTDELRRLTGHEEKEDDQLKEELFGLGLEFEGETEDGDLQFEFAPDRLDRLSVEGVARSLRYHYGDDRGVDVPDTNDAEWTIQVDESVPDERPYVAGAVVRGVDLDEDALDSLIQLQEKLHATMGRKRAKGAIGIHDLAMLKGERVEQREIGEGNDLEPPEDLTPVGGDEGPTDVGGPTITYRGIDPAGDEFVPLDADAGMTPAEVLTDHPTGEEYADLVGEYGRYPAIYDELGLFSFPPVINGQRTEVTTDSRELLVELTGTDQWTIDRMLAIICYALDARGATIEEIDVVYDDGAAGERAGDHLVRPELDTRQKTVSHDRIETTLGIELGMEDVTDLFERSGLDVTTNLGERTEYEVEIPPYRVDVLHPSDLVDDVGRAYGFGDLEPEYPDIGTIGGRHERSRLERATRTALVGLGFEDLLNFHLSSPAENYERMGVEEGADALGGGEAVEVTSAYSEDYTQLRTWALPSIMHVLENNTHRRYPQELAEVGFVAEQDDGENTHVAEHRTVAAAIARTDATYEDIKGRLQALVGEFDADLETPATTHPSFIDGRAAEVVIDGESVGVIGELHPRVLVERDLEVPVAAFEFRLDALAE